MSSATSTVSQVSQSATYESVKGSAIHLSSRRLLVVVFFLIIFTGASRPITDPDFWWHLKTGQYIVETRSIPHTDIFSTFHFGKRWVTHEWLSELFMYSIYDILGYGGLMILFSSIITGAFLIAYYPGRSRAGHPYVWGFALLVGSFSTLPTWGVRPQMFSLLFASIFLAILNAYSLENRKRMIWWLVPLTACWVNLHAGFALSPVLILLTIVGLGLDGLLSEHQSLPCVWRRIAPLCAVAFACVAAAALNPNGIGIYAYPLETVKSHAMMKYISEWWSPDFHEPMFQPFALLIFSTFASLALSPKRVSLRQMLLLAFTLCAALRSARNVPFFALTAIPLLAEHCWLWLTNQSWGQWLARPETIVARRDAKIKAALNVVLLVLIPLGLAFTRVAQSAVKQSAVSTQEFPSAAVDFLASKGSPQPIYNEYGWGGYLIWRLYPQYHVYIDGRADVYGDEFLEEFLAIHSGEQRWQETLNRYGVRTVLVKPDAAIASLLRQDLNWQKVFEDNQAVIFTKKD